MVVDLLTCTTADSKDGARGSSTRAPYTISPFSLPNYNIISEVLQCTIKKVYQTQTIAICRVQQEKKYFAWRNSSTTEHTLAGRKTLHLRSPAPTTETI